METEEVKLPAVSLGPSPGLTAPSFPTRTAGASSSLLARLWPRWRLVLAYGVGSLILVATVVVSVVSHNTLQRTDASVAELHVQLHRTVVAQARTRLTQAEQEAGTAAGALASASDQLGKVQAQLASAQSNIQIDGVNIANLDTCLSGVNQALNEISLGNQSGASAILNRYAGNCQAAEPSG